MEPVTHILTGACLARAGLNRRAAYATAAMAIAAEFPDMDTLWSLRGPVSGFEHHRGITHTFLGIPFEAAVLLLGFVLFHHHRGGKAAPRTGEAASTPRSRVAPPAIAPVRWGVLYALLLLALLSHLLLDYTNNYGLRPFFPFDPHWYAGSIVFIFDPLIFLLLVAGLVMPSLFDLIGREVGARKERYRGRGWARFALICIALLWGVRWFEHSKAIHLSQSQTLRSAGRQTATPEDTAQDAPAPEIARPLLQPLRSLASPDPFSIFRWYTVTDFGPAYQLGVADARIGIWTPGQVLHKPEPASLLLAGERSRLGSIYLDWSPLPVLSVDPGDPPQADLDPPARGTDHTVRFSDPRFMADTPLLHQRGRPPLTGEVVLDPGGGVIAEGMDGRFGK